MQAAIVGIIIGKPAVGTLTHRHVELDIGRYRNIERLSLHIQEIGQLLGLNLRLGKLGYLEK